jgi:pimeloyl-ACP methyl ester carboxylesterase
VEKKVAEQPSIPFFANASWPRLVLLPGMHGDGELFSDFMKALPTNFASSASFYPNDVCPSYADHLRAVELNAAEYGPFVMLGESYSSPISIQFAAKRPANLKGLVLSAGFATSPVRGVLRWIAPALMPALSYLPVNTIGARIMVPGRMVPGSAPARMRDAIAAMKPKVLMDRVRSVLDCDVLEDLRKIEVPVLYLQSRDDRLVNSVCLEEIRRVKPEIEVMVMDSSHMILQEVPREAAEIVAEFVRRL